MRRLRLNEKNALVCGATAGLGRELARELAQTDIANLFLVGRNVERLETAATELRSLTSRVSIHTIPVDVTDRMALETAVRSIQQDFGRIHLLIQAVGLSDRGKILELSQPRLAELWEANVQSSLNVLQCFASLLEAKEPDSTPSTFVLIGSLATLFAPRHLGGYALVKHALAALAQQARLELASAGIHVLLVCPGPISRDDAGERYQAQSAGLPKEAQLPGGGAKMSGLDPNVLSREIIRAACHRKRRLIRPRYAALLMLIGSLSPWLADAILRKRTS